MLSALVIGGGSGGRLSADALVRSSRYELAGIADLRAETRAELATAYPGASVFPGVEEALAARPYDVVCVSTYAPSHLPLTLRAIHAGAKGILLEKPLADSTAAAKQALSALRAANLPVVVPHGMLTLATPQGVLREIRGGAIGRLEHIRIQCRGWDAINAGIHWLHFCLSVLEGDAVASVDAEADIESRTYRDGMMVETDMTMRVTMASGVVIEMRTGDFTPTEPADRSFVFHFRGSEGSVEFYGWDVGYWLNGTWIVPEGGSVSGHQWYLEYLADQIAGAPRDERGALASLAALEIIESAYATVNTRSGSSWRLGEPYSGVGGGRDGRKL